jgi:hypothetical protein
MEVFFLSRDKITVALPVLAILLAAFSTLISADSAQKSYEQTEKTLKITDNTLKLTETEQEIRDIERSLDLFYYPLRDFLDKHVIQSVSNYSISKIERELVNIGHYRYLATDETRKYFEKYQSEFLEYGNATPKEHITDLSISVANDIKLKEDDLQKLNNLKAQTYQSKSN